MSNTEKKERANGSRWDVFDNGVYPVNVLLFIGSRADMRLSIMEGLSILPRKISGSDAGAFALKLRQMFAYDNKSINGECIRLEIDSGANLWIVRMDDFRGYVEDAVMLSHECLHAALSVLGFCGVSEDPPFEALCYLHEAIFKRFMMFAYGRIGMLYHGKPESFAKERGDA